MRNSHSLLESSNVTLPTLDEIKQISTLDDANKYLHRIQQLLQLHIDDDDMLTRLNDIRRSVLHKNMLNYLNHSVRIRNANRQQSD